MRNLHRPGAAINGASVDLQSTTSASAAVVARAAQGEIPPGSNTGGNSFSGLPSSSFGRLAHVDTLTATLPLLSLSDDVKVTVLHDYESIAERVNSAFLAPLGFSMGLPTGQRINGYVDSSPILAAGVDSDTNGKTNFGYVAWGGNRNKAGHDTCCIYLTGQACESVNLLDDRPDLRIGSGPWSLFYTALYAHGAKLTRCDVAHDDLGGRNGGVEAGVDAYHAGGFSATRKPSVSTSGDWINGHGRTLYVGNRANGKLVRVYEKGHQLGNPESPWVRYELELRSRDRVIPLEILLDPAAYLAGSSRYMALVLRDVEPVPVRTVVRERLQTTLDDLCTHARRAYGRLINALSGSGMTPRQIVDYLRVDGLPSRLYVPPAAC